MLAFSLQRNYDFSHRYFPYIFIHILVKLLNFFILIEFYFFLNNPN